MEQIPRELAAVMRPELPGLLKEMAAEIVTVIPEYRELLEGPNARVIRVGIEQNIATFVDQVAAPAATTALRDEICRGFGRHEAYEGRSLDMLHDAYRIGCQVALRRVRTVGRRYNLSATVLMAFADALFAYMGEIAELSREGYLQAMAELGEEPDNRRRRLLRRILGGTSVARGALAELAELAVWPLPQEVTLVALGPGARPARAALDRDVLVDLAGREPYLLVPGPLDERRRRALATALAGCPAAVGLTTPLGEAAHSLRWARQLLALTADRDPAPCGPGAPPAPVYCEDHLVQLWLLGDRALARQIAQRRLAPLAGLTPARRARLLDTLRIWLTTRATAGEMAEQLGVHPQTVRYRIRALERAFGDQLADADTRFATEVALRALHLTDPAPGVTDPAPGVTGPPPHPAGPVPPGHPRRCD
ncbi:helix-turn-helix domain-containing protein [Kitasatospora sp. NPDC048540]|uniref:PucR family transcriptional regulator n=2 Tax=unclassified Kitasatospora TaxID=2633591 RepID=UPI0033E736BB